MWPFKSKSSEKTDQPVEDSVVEHQPKQKSRKRYVARGFQGAQTDRFNSEWNTTPTPINNLLKNSLRALRARSRDLYLNDDYAKRFIELNEINVIGPRGFQLQAQCKDSSGELDKDLNKAIEKAFKLWTRPRNCHWEGQYSFLDIENLIISEIKRDGEFIAQKLVAGKFAYQIKVIDAELLDVNYNKKLSNGRYISMGIEFDAQNRKKAFHFLTDDRSQDQVYSYYGRNYQRVSADKIYHYFIPVFSNQIRGIPAMHASMRRLKNLAGYEWAAIVAARSGAQKMGFFYEDDVEASSYVDDEEDTEENELITESEAGTWEKLPPGVKAETYDPTYPHQQYPEFVKATLRGAASGMGVNYNTLANDLEGVNFSSIRHATLEDRELWKKLQEFMIEHPIIDIYEDWLKYALLKSQIKIGDQPVDFAEYDRCLDVAFIPRRWEWIDPVKDTQAKSMQIKQGITSLSQVIRDQGKDPEDTFNEIKAERELLNEMGVEIEFNDKGKIQQQSGSEEDDSGEKTQPVED